MVCLVKAFCVALLIHRGYSDQAVHFNEACFRSVGTYFEDSVFVTTSIRNFEDCVRTCEWTTSCRFVNYWVRGHLCSLTNYIGELSVVVSEDTLPGYVSWMKSATNMGSYNSSVTCAECNATQSCVFDDTLGACKIFACGRPPLPGTVVTTGNMYRVADRLTVICSGQSVSHTLVCSSSGQWEGLPNDCVYPGYTEYSLADGTTFMIKIVDNQVSQQTAMQNCQSDGASLTTVLSYEKLVFFRSLLDGRSEDYWVDVERDPTDSSKWYTSDGRLQPINNQLWHRHTLDSVPDNCARLQSSESWKLNDDICDDTHGYICELTLA